MSKYSEVLETLTKRISSKNRNLNNQEKKELVKELLHSENPENHNEWSNLEINLDTKSTQVLAKYSRQLEESYNQEIGKNISQTIQKVDKTTEFRNRIHQEVNQALSETKELEKIAKRLQDKGIGKIAGKEEKQVNKLGENLERIDQEGRQLEKDKEKIIGTLESHNLDQNELHNELGRRASAVETILKSYGSGSVGGSTTKLDQITQRMIQKESKLREAENRGLQQLEEDIKTLSRMVELEEQEISALRQVEENLKTGNLDFVSTKPNYTEKDFLDELVEKREEFGQNSEQLKKVRRDLQDEQDIVKALSSFFHSLEEIEQSGIGRDKLYTEISSKGPFSSVQEAKTFLEGIETEFEAIKDDIKRIENLEGKERKLENLEHEKIREIDKKDSELRKQADTTSERRKLKKIHESLKKLDFDLQKQIIAFKHDEDLENWGQLQSFDKASTEDMRDWKPIIAHPEDHLEVRDRVKNISDRKITYYDISDEDSTFSYPDNYANRPAPKQGFKFHVTAYPHEAYEVCKELIPILQKLGVNHKVMTDIRDMATSMDGKGNFSSVQGMKLFTIYPGLTKNDPNTQEFIPGDIEHNKDHFFANQSQTEYLMEKILDYADSSIMKGGPKLEGNRRMYGINDLTVKEYRIGNTRLHLTYSFISGSRAVNVNGNRVSVEDWVREKDSNGDWQSRGNFRESGSFDKNGNYNSSDYFLSHLISKNKSNQVKKSLVEGSDPSNAIIGLDGKIAGSYYLPPPEGIQRIQQMISNL